MEHEELDIDPDMVVNYQEDPPVVYKAMLKRSTLDLILSTLGNHIDASNCRGLEEIALKTGDMGAAFLASQYKSFHFGRKIRIC